ncbi:MAG: DnaJ domain-containing protein [Salinibacter sp.]|uniref:J domain-containing protein n=1 Tax=Salinibacter sp. TaxID=2065818 RepID=UPI0035D49A7E
MTPDQNHYEVLGVSDDASQSEIEKAFYQKVREHPPEQDQEGHERIREAYDVLSNPVSRREYDNLAAHGEKIEQLKDEAERILNQENPGFEKAIKNLKKAVVLGPEIGLLRNHLGQAYLQNGNPGDALDQFDKAVELDEKNTAYRLNRGHALESLDRLGEAEKAFRGVWEEDEGDYAAARALARVLFHQEKAEEAHEVLDTAIWADDKLDFEDFFCYYDKLRLYVAQGETEILKDELETVKDLPETEDDRKYAAFMLAQTGQMLVEANVYRLAQEFVDAAVELDPENPRLQAAQEFVRENAQIEQSFEEIAESSSIHDFVKHVVAVFYQRYLGVIDEEEFKERTEEIDVGLQNVMGVDPDNTEIKESVRHIRDQYPQVFQLNESAFEAILSIPSATRRVDDCPHCGDPIQFEKGTSGRGTCSGCSGTVKISGGTVKDPTRTSRKSTSRTSSTKSSRSTSTSGRSSSRSKDKSSGTSESSTQESGKSSDSNFFDYAFWGAVVLGFIIPPHVWGFFVLIAGVFIYAVKD